MAKTRALGAFVFTLPSVFLQVSSTMQWYLLGCDPDSRGALAVISGPNVGDVRTIQVLDCPCEKLATRSVVSIEKMVERVRDLGIPTGTVIHFEHCSSRPGLSAPSALVFGRLMGAQHAALVFCGLVVRLVRPVTWKAALKLTANKSESVSTARDLFQNAEGVEQMTKRAHGRAEARLITAHGHWIARRDAGRSVRARVRECDDVSVGSPWCRKKRSPCRNVRRKPLPSLGWILCRSRVESPFSHHEVTR